MHINFFWFQVTAVSMEGILVGLDISGCAFVYASLSFLDKFACGIALFAIEALNSKSMHNLFI